MQNCLSILGFLDAVYSVLQKSIPYRVLLYVNGPMLQIYIHKIRKVFVFIIIFSYGFKMLF
ncbi:MAG: hypothetical protein ACRY3E_04040 [Candidatus Lariskella arthropodorum]